MELDVGVFQNEVLKHFPAVRASGWMEYLGPGRDRNQYPYKKSRVFIQQKCLAGCSTHKANLCCFFQFFYSMTSY